MASKYKLVSNSLYIEDTDIPKNKHNITDSEIIHEIEGQLFQESYTYFQNFLEEETVFDENYFKLLHYKTFFSLYDWAGEYRSFNMAKGESRFCQGAFIESQMKELFAKLKEDNYLKEYQNKSKEEFAKKVAYYKCELIAIHPFAELNGRTTRLFFDMITYYNYKQFLNYSHYSRKEYIDASIECVQYADNSKLEEIILRGMYNAFKKI